MRRSFPVWFGDTACGLVAYVASRQLWQGQAHGWSTLLPELGTFAGFYLLLQLVLRLASSIRRRKREESAARSAAAQVLRKSPPPPPPRPAS